MLRHLCDTVGVSGFYEMLRRVRRRLVNTIVTVVGIGQVPITVRSLSMAFWVMSSRSVSSNCSAAE